MSAPRRSAGNLAKRNLPVWMSSSGEGTKSHNEDPTDDGNMNESSEGGGTLKVARGSNENVGSNTSETRSEHGPASSGQNTGYFSKLLEGVVFALSGFVNPERSILRAQALEMGAEYQPDWNSNCTLLVCAFPNTPKFRQVEAQCGTIVSKEWITECYTQKKLVDIDSHLMHAGKPWRKSSVSRASNNDDGKPPSRKPQKQEEVQQRIDPVSYAQSKASRSESSRNEEGKFSPSVVKKWAADDLIKTSTWLQSQDEKPEPSEIRNVAAGGVLTCLQDAIELLEQKQNLQQLGEQWNFLPHVVEQLLKMEASGVSNDITLKQAFFFKKIYEEELSYIDEDPHTGKGKHLPSKSVNDSKKSKGKEVVVDRSGYDSDETIEMTEDEINVAFQSIASRKPV